MSQQPIVKVIQPTQALSGSTAWVYIGDIDQSSMSVRVVGTYSGSYEVQGSNDQASVLPIWGLSGSTGAGAAATFNLNLPPPGSSVPSGSFLFARLSNARFNQNAGAGGAISCSFMGSARPFSP